MKLNSYLRCIAILAIIAVTLFSCNNDEELKSKELLVYLKNDNNANYNETSIDFVSGSKQTVGDPKRKFTVKVTREITQDIAIQLGTNDKLVDTYNKSHGTNYILLPTANYSLANEGRTTISKGKIDSDSLTLVINKPTDLDRTKKYLLPLVITNVNSSDNGAIASTNHNTMYFIVTNKSLTASIRPTDNPGSNTMDMTYLVTPIGNKAGTPKSVTIGINQSLPTLDLSLKIVQGGNDLVTAYNKSNGTSLSLLPQSNYSLSNSGQVLISKGSTTSQPATITIIKPETLTNTGEYLLPLIIGDDGKAYIDAKKNVVYVRVLSQQSNIDASQPTVSGQLIDRTNWELDVSSTYSYDSGYEKENMIDGNSHTSWISDYSDTAQTVKLYMNSGKTVKGFTLMRSYEMGSDNNFRSLKVYSSPDGVNWTVQGNLTTSTPGGSMSHPEIVNVSFYSPVNARYFKFEMSGNIFLGVAELNALE